MFMVKLLNREVKVQHVKNLFTGAKEKQKSAIQGRMDGDHIGLSSYLCRTIQ